MVIFEKLNFKLCIFVSLKWLIVCLQVSKATEFLINSTIKNTSMDKRINFLRSKGLTEDEIKLSIKRAAMIFNQNQQSFVPNSHQFVSYEERSLFQ